MCQQGESYSSRVFLIFYAILTTRLFYQLICSCHSPTPFQSISAWKFKQFILPSTCSLECSFTSSSLSFSSQTHSFLSLSSRFHKQLKTHLFFHIIFFISFLSFPFLSLYEQACDYRLASELKGPGSSPEITNFQINICWQATINALGSLFTKQCKLIQAAG